MNNALALLDDRFLAVIAILVVILGPARLTRVLTYDTFPPAAWVRAQWDRLTEKSGWNMLLHCFWCANPWMTAAAVTWFLLASGWVLAAWWIFWGVLALAYVGSIVIRRDEPAN
jgi:hypothetical protein